MNFHGPEARANLFPSMNMLPLDRFLVGGRTFLLAPLQNLHMHRNSMQQLFSFAHAAVVVVFVRLTPI